MKSVVVLGGSGIFGGRIVSGLASYGDIHVKIASRNPDRAAAFAEDVGAELIRCNAFDSQSLASVLQETDLLVHTAGPFQGNDYRVAEACLKHGVHYLDISDGREFVCGITTLDTAAKKRGIVVGSGASSVPTITHAMIDELVPAFSDIDTIQIALSPGNQNPRGPSTVGAILTYLGRPIRVWEDKDWKTISGWSDCRILDFPKMVGKRRVYRCDVPDLELFPSKWDFNTLRFHAGVELNLINHFLTAIAGLRGVLPMPWLPKLAPIMTRLSLLIYPWGSKNGALSVWITGTDSDGARIERRIAIMTDDDGPATPSAPGILLARKIVDGDSMPAGAYPCHGHLTLSEIEEHLKQFGIWKVKGDASGWEDGS